MDKVYIWTGSSYGGNCNRLIIIKSIFNLTKGQRNTNHNNMYCASIRLSKITKHGYYSELVRMWENEHFFDGHVHPFVLFLFFVFLPLLGPFPRHMEVPRLGVESEL